jgi:hypothetical protein
VSFGLYELMEPVAETRERDRPARATNRFESLASAAVRRCNSNLFPVERREIIAGNCSKQSALSKTRKRAPEGIC